MHPVYGRVDCIIYGWFPTLIDLISDDQLILQFSVILTMNEELNLLNYKCRYHKKKKSADELMRYIIFI